MYGLLLQSAVDHLKGKYGEETWEKIRKEANISFNGFATHNIYGENIMVDMAEAAAKITGDTMDTIMDSFGVEFVNFVGQFGYDRILKVLGRHMRDFLNGLDNLHEYLRFSYPKLKPPSFFVEDETKNGLTLTYRSRRRGFLHYVKGQIRQVGKVFYNTRVDIFVVATDYNEATQTTHVKFRLLFDNKAFREVSNHFVDNIVDSIPLRPELLFELFPFHIVFSRKMEIRSVGPGLRAVLPTALGKSLSDLFNLERPLSNFTWEDILHHTNNVFQLVGKTSLRRSNEVIEESNHPAAGKEGVTADLNKDSTDETPDPPHDSTGSTVVIHLKGQMMYMNEWDCIMFLGTPIMSSLDDMFKIGLYINDLSMHDSSRDLVLAGTQQSAELKLALDQEQEKSRLLEQSMIKLDQEMQRTDALLYQMIPKPVADRLRKGVPSVDTCQVFDNVTILFSDVVGFTTICSQITPMEVVSMLNAMYTKFDQLSERHSVYKVETIGDAYMAVSGAPIVTKYHALHMCDMALDMRASMNTLYNPSNNETMKIRIGVHTGTTVAGVVGMKMPRYCLFGDTVNTASRMETSGEAMKIHISETTKTELEGYPYDVEERGSIEVKGKGKMKTYWLTSKRNIRDLDRSKCPFITIMEEEVRNRNKDEQNESNMSRLNMSTGPPVSPSPIPYSPVSYRDVLDERSSPGGRRTPREPTDGEASRAKGVASPRGYKTGSPGCPFTAGLLGGSPQGEAHPKSPSIQSPAKKKLEQTPQPSVASNNSSSSRSNNPATSSITGTPAAAAAASSSSRKETKPEPTPAKKVEPESSKSSQQTKTSTVIVTSPQSTSEAPVLEPTRTLPSRPAQDSHTASLTSNPAPTAVRDKNKTVTSRVGKVTNSSASADPQINDNRPHKTPPQDSISSFQNKSPESDSVKALNSRATSVATIKSASQKPDLWHTALINNQEDNHVRAENGTLGHKVAPSTQNFDIYQTDKRSSMVNGTHVIKSEVGCLSGSRFDKNNSTKKSRTCQVL